MNKMRNGGHATLLNPEQIKKFGGIGLAFFLAPLEPVYTEILRQKNMVNCHIDKAMTASQRMTLCHLISAKQELQSDLKKMNFIADSSQGDSAQDIPISVVLDIKSELCTKYACAQ